MPIDIIVTNAGRAAIVNAQNTGTAPVTISHVGVSATAVVGAPTATTLAGEIKRVATVSGEVVAADTIHLSMLDSTADAYTLRSIALYLADGTLFAIYGQPTPILEKVSGSVAALSVDVIFADISAASLTFGNAEFVNPPATTERQGVVELTTLAEAIAGSDAIRALTAAGAKGAVLNWLLSQDGSGSGLDADLLDGRQAYEFVLDSNFTGGGVLSRLLTVDGAGSGLDADLLDGQHASAFATAGHSHGTMADQNANAVNITGGAIAGVTLNNVAGNVGFGTAAPLARIDVATSNPQRGIVAVVRNYAVTGQNGCQLEFTQSAIANWTIGQPGGANAFAFFAGRSTGSDGTEVFRIAPNGSFSSNGSAVIGNGTGTQSLTIATARSYLGFEADGATNGAGSTISYSWSSGGQGPLKFANSSGEVARFSPGGNLGIGTADPIARFHVKSSAEILRLETTAARGAGTAYMAIHDASGRKCYIGYGSFSDTLHVVNEMGAPIIFGTGGNYRLVLDETGNLVPSNDGAQILGWPSARFKAGHFSDFVRIAGNDAYHAGNDGSGSGLDADLLDGRQAYEFVLDANFTGGGVLSRLLTVDGAGSGLDADLLDGQHAADFARLADFTGANQSKAQSGYQKLPGGLIVQWGRFTASSNGSTSVTLPIAFPSLACVAVVSGTSSAGADAKDNTPETYSLTNSTLTVYSADDGATATHYIVIGF